ncbi:MAG: SUMF1/EgtB/PvdO family nonheme iron enzyme [Saprospiraceae bacterium]|nr:SUMF1/EgtB/PvdO family nonheme iron enzyme [Saprospiraceae bacterium]
MSSNKLLKITKNKPPNGVYVRNGFYIDKTEVSNINYRGYLYFLKHRYSDQSLYFKALPDTTVWIKYDTCLVDLVYSYLRGPEYDDYPVVGISFQQAENYSKWRSDRVLEMLLITNKIIPFNRKSEIDKVFTIEDFYSSYNRKYNTNDSLKYYIEFSIPTMDEWNISSIFQDSLFKVLKCKSEETIWYKKSIDWCTNKTMPLVPVNWGCRDSKLDLIYNMYGNVSEWLYPGQYSIGGSFNDDISEINSTSLKTVEKATSWLGFRNVSRWKRWQNVESIK